jgi:hypothetical protein
MRGSDSGPFPKLTQPEQPGTSWKRRKIGLFGFMDFKVFLYERSFCQWIVKLTPVHPTNFNWIVV